MKTEYEATFWPIEPEAIRAMLQSIGAERVYPMRLMRRVTFNLAAPIASPDRWARVRDEGDRITMSVKDVSGDAIENQREAEVIINDFEQGLALLRALGCTEKAYQETRRELWMLDGIEITIDEWPFLEPLLEIEGESEAAARSITEKLGLDWQTARFCAITPLYAEKYGISEERINNETPRIVFDGRNPFT